MKFEASRPSTFTPFIRRWTDERARDLADIAELYRRVTSAHAASYWAREGVLEEVTEDVLQVVAANCTLPASSIVRDALFACAKEILALEKTIFDAADVDFDTAVLSLKEQVDLRRFLRAQEHFLTNQQKAIVLLLETLGGMFAGIAEALPRIPDTTAGLTVPLYALVGNANEIVDKIIGTVCKDELIDVGLCAYLQTTFYENMCAASGIAPYEETKKRLVNAVSSPLPPEKLIATYLGKTPFAELLATRVPFQIPESARYEHCWMVAGSGHGKTQALQHLIADDLKLVADGKASVIVIDSQSDMIRAISGLKAFGSGGDLDGKLCLIDPHDIGYPVCLNLFDVNLDRINEYSPLDRERLINGILELYDFVLGSLLSAELTAKQSVIFRYMMRAMLVIPDANIQTLRQLVEPNGYDKFREHLSRLTGTARAFFETEFNSRQFTETKQQILRRLWSILENGVFERMFSHPRNKLDLFKEMNSGKVILINTAKDLLKQEGTQIFGRFFIAMIAQAAQERATLQERLPCFVYIDEAADYFDQNVALILEQARKYKVGLTLAHQYLGQLPQKLLESFAANTAIKMAGGVSDKDARAFASMLRSSPQFIEEQGKGSFATFVRNVTASAISLHFPFGHVEAMVRLSSNEAEKLRANMRERYCVPYNEVQHSIASQIPPEHTFTNPDSLGTDSSQDWK